MPLLFGLNTFYYTNNNDKSLPFLILKCEKQQIVVTKTILENHSQNGFVSLINLILNWSF